METASETVVLGLAPNKLTRPFPPSLSFALDGFRSKWLWLKKTNKNLLISSSSSHVRLYATGAQWHKTSHSSHASTPFCLWPVAVGRSLGFPVCFSFLLFLLLLLIKTAERKVYKHVINSKTIWGRENFFAYLVLFFVLFFYIRWFKLDNANSDAELEKVIDLTGQDCSGPMTQTSFPLGCAGWWPGFSYRQPNSPPSPPLIFRADMKKRTWLAFMHWRAVISSCWGGRNVSGRAGGRGLEWRRGSASVGGDYGWASRTLASLCTSLEACFAQFRRCRQEQWWRWRWCSSG